MARERKSNSYFASFEALVGCSSQAAKLLKESMASYDPETLQARLAEMHGIEHNGDQLRHEMIARLAKEFITPIEREDIMQLSSTIDDVTDAIEDVLMRMYMFNVRAPRREAIEFTNLIVELCGALEDAMREFENFHKSTILHKRIVEVNRLEEDGDARYTAAMRNLYVQCKDPIEIQAWTQIFEQLEGCCDACEDVADVIESVILKNT